MTDIQKISQPEIRPIGTSRLRRELTNCRSLLASIRRLPGPDAQRYVYYLGAGDVARSIEAELEHRAHQSIAQAAF